MTGHDDETLMRYLDGDLGSAEAARIEAEALADPAVAARLEAIRRVGDLAQAAFPITADPRDAALARQIAAPPPKRRPATQTPAFWTGLLAASFVAGIIVGPLWQGSSRGIVVTAGGKIGDAGLVRVLDRRLASEGMDNGGRLIGLTYRDAGGHWCRTFVAPPGVAGLACRQDGRWAIRALSPLGPAGGEVRTAGVQIPAAILSAVDASLVGETLDAPAEARARDAGWR